jgi:hypothetical protein
MQKYEGGFLDDGQGNAAPGIPYRRLSYAFAFAVRNGKRPGTMPLFLAASAQEM